VSIIYARLLATNMEKNLKLEQLEIL
jgi:hypothetical protein